MHTLALGLSAALAASSPGIRLDLAGSVCRYRMTVDGKTAPMIATTRASNGLFYGSKYSAFEHEDFAVRADGTPVFYECRTPDGKLERRVDYLPEGTVRILDGDSGKTCTRRAPKGALDSHTLGFVLEGLPLEDGARFDVLVFSAENRRTVRMALLVEGEERVPTPRGGVLCHRAHMFLAGSLGLVVRRDSWFFLEKGAAGRVAAFRGRDFKGRDASGVLESCAPGGFDDRPGSR
jgi:hypothetical protein